MKKAFYLTSYALTKGIIQVDGYLDKNGYVRHSTHKFHRLGYEIFSTREEARAKQVVMANKALIAAQKKAKLMQNIIDSEA